MNKTTTWDDNLVWNEGVKYELDKMSRSELVDLENSLRASVKAIEAQLGDRYPPQGYVDEEWQRRAGVARTIKLRQAEHIAGLILSRPSPPEMPMSAALAKVAGKGARPSATPTPAQQLVFNDATGLELVARPSIRPTVAKQPTRPARTPAGYFMLAARVVLHPAIFTAIEQHAAWLEENETNQ